MEPGLYNMDCMKALPQFPDKFFDLAIVDPPYGGGYTGDGEGLVGGGQTGSGISAAASADGLTDTTLTARPFPMSRRGGALTAAGTSSACKAVAPTGASAHADAGASGLIATISVARTGGTWATKYGQQGGVFDEADVRHWDIAPSQEYFRELARVSKNQIIWGGNYFDLPPTRCFLVWDKGIPEKFTMAMCEYAWTSFNANAKMFKCAPQGTAREPRFHPTQKPVALYTWQLRLFSEPGMRILDTHAGSASSLVACHRAGLACWGFEIDPEYYRLGKARLDKEAAQVSFFELGGDL